MSRWRWIRLAIVASVALAWVGSGVAFRMQATPEGQLLSMGMALLFFGAGVASVAILIRHWRTQRWPSALPLAVCVAAVPLSSVAGDAAQAHRFAADLPGYERVIARADVQALQPGERLEDVPLSSAEQQGCYWVGAQRMANAGLVVEFACGAGFPVKHSGYVYVSADMPARTVATQKRWPYRTSMRTHWLAVSD